MNMDAIPAQTPKRRSFLQYLRRLVFALFLVLFAALIVLMPEGIAYGIKSWIMTDSGLQVKIEDIDFNPTAATFALYGLEIEQQKVPVLAISELQIRMTWTPLMEKQALINRVIIKGVRMLVDRSNPERLQVGGITLPQGSLTTAEQQPSDSPWGFNLEKLTIQDSEIHYRDANLDTRFRIDNLELIKLVSYLPEKEEYGKKEVYWYKESSYRCWTWR
jgi:hypothetical protein